MNFFTCQPAVLSFVVAQEATINSPNETSNYEGDGSNLGQKFTDQKSL